MKPRQGVTLIELLVVIGILALMIGLILGAVQSTRAAAIRLQSQNNLRQVIFATHQLADQEAGRIGGLTKTNLPKKPLYTESSIFWDLLPWTHGGPKTKPENMTPEQALDWGSPIVKCYRSPADPSLILDPEERHRGKCSYSCNMLVFNGSFTMPFSLPDGTHSTIAYSERYGMPSKSGEIFLFDRIFPAAQDVAWGNTRRATFADTDSKDVMPVKDAATGQTVASRRGVTFQLRPTVEEADGKMLQTPYPGGLPVAFFDGSVRTLSPSIAETVFWSMVTPNGGEVVSHD